MCPEQARRIQIHDYQPGHENFRADVLHGLHKRQKELPCKYFYDERGSYLFDCICALDEYYIPATERAITRASIGEIAELIGSGSLLIEYGSGNCTKTRFLLDHLCEVAAYIPIDIAREQLLSAAAELMSAYAELEVLPVCADYTGDFDLPAVNRPHRLRLVYFPGSTIGNFDPVPAARFLQQIASLGGIGSGLLIGVDLKKDPSVLHRAYNDSRGVTAAFNLNMLERINRELGGDFQPEYFEHYAFYNPVDGRIEMHLVSLREQVVHLDGTAITFSRGESIRTEKSYKYTLDELERLAAAAGFSVEQVWTDERQWFSVQYLVNRGRAPD